MSQRSGLLEQMDKRHFGHGLASVESFPRLSLLVIVTLYEDTCLLEEQEINKGRNVGIKTGCEPRCQENLELIL